MKFPRQLTPDQAAALVPSGATIMAGGFGMTGNPVHLLHALARTTTRDLTYIGNNVGEPDLGGGRLLRNGQIRKAIGSYFTSNPDAVKAAHEHRLEVTLLPQGSLAEAIRAGGAGLGGFFTPTAAGTVISEGSETRLINGRQHVFVPALRADVAFIRAWQADTSGNLVYRMTEQNFNRAMATAADLVIAEVQHIVPTGQLDPNAIHTPGLFVDVLVQATLEPADLGTSAEVLPRSTAVTDPRLLIAERAFRALRPGTVVNLGVGIPTLITDFITPDSDILLHTENGMLGIGPSPREGGAMDYPVNAGKIPVTPLPGSSYFDSADSFAMIRGGHIDTAVMGGLQVDAGANLANWAVPGQPLLGVGGAMDLAVGARSLIATMTHVQKDGTSKVVPQCTLPLTAAAAVDILITDLAVFEFPAGRLTLVELMPGVSLQQVQQHTTARFEIALRR
ncbi:MAG: 3-oxoacid CoA-transferase subunit B [Anaerolineae bacterium]|nr:MAG: 3-oxoacid CoA-transferase subunit B [Anaerolineae bacterium]